MNNAELLELLKEARNWVGGWSGILPMAMKDIDALRERIDAALAAPEAEARVEWHTHERSTICEGVICTIGYSPKADYEDPWWWRADNTKTGKWKFDRVETEDEAKAAAIAAARGMR